MFLLEERDLLRTHLTRPLLLQHLRGLPFHLNSLCPNRRELLKVLAPLVHDALQSISLGVNVERGELYLPNLRTKRRSGALLVTQAVGTLGKVVLALQAGV